MLPKASIRQDEFPGLALSDPKLNRLLALIDESFRVERNHDPIYIDVAGNLAKFAAPQHEVVFGRRGSGKSCLLVYHLRRGSAKGVTAVYINADEIKRLTYPDVLIRLVLSIMEAVGSKRPLKARLKFRKVRRLSQAMAELRALLDEAETSKVQQSKCASKSRESKLGIENFGIAPSIGEASGSTVSLTQEYTRKKIDYLERHLSDFRSLLVSERELQGRSQIDVLVDDFYLIRRDVQPDVADYLHRLLRGTAYYLKIATIRHRTTLIRHDAQTIGVELTQDVGQIDLDYTLEDLNGTKAQLAEVLDSLGKRAGISQASTEFLSPDGLSELTLASGGVPRDYLTIFSQAVHIARQMGEDRWVTPRHVSKAGARNFYRTKLNALTQDAEAEAGHLEAVFADLLSYILGEKKKTVFLVSQEEARSMPDAHSQIRQLMDAKLVHIVEPDTSAAANRPGRYEAYTLDRSCFMEPRLKRIDIVRFWEFDESKRRLGVREAPSYPLARASGVKGTGTGGSSEAVLEQLEREDATEIEPGLVVKSQPDLPF